ncbi:MAG: hypothetical protein KC505_11545 [Myxococcales bacterium]|nr:hypothetical protein [Myxococcales bacterium]USN50946.1 MAG: hypothetical protein H6731_00575 [Myxococcales bacterium]
MNLLNFKKLFVVASVLTPLVFSAEIYAAEKQDELGFKQVMNILDEQIKLGDLSDTSALIAKELMNEILLNESAYNTLKNDDGNLVLDESAARYIFGSLKDKATSAINKGLEKYYNSKDYAREKYDAFQEKLDEKMPGFRNSLADALVAVNETLSKIDPKVVGKIVKIAGSIIGATSSILGAAFGVPVIPGLAISIATAVLGNSYTVSGALAGAKTLLDIAEHVLRVDPDATPQDDTEKGNALKKIAEAVRWVGQHYIDNYSVYKPEEVEAVKAGLKAIGKIFAYFM